MKKDWIGLWFVIQDQRGHSDEVPLYFFNPGTKDLKNFSFRHRETDGMGVFTKALKTLNFTPSRTSLPIKKPPFWKRPLLIYRGLSAGERIPTPPWKRLNLERRQKDLSLSFLLLNEESTQKLKNFVKEKKVSMNSYLIQKTTQVIDQHLLHPHKSWQANWLLPVDMRGAFPKWGEGRNCVSYLPITVSKNSDYNEIHCKIRHAFKKNKHWSNWWAYHIGKIIGFEAMKKISKKVSAKNYWLGSLTDLGDWTPKNQSALDYKDWTWAVAAPGTPNNPIGLASLEWFGKRSISLRVHPSVRPDLDSPWDEIMLKSLSELIGTDLSLPSPNHLEIHRVSPGQGSRKRDLDL